MKKSQSKVRLLFFSHYFSPDKKVGATRANRFMKYLDQDIDALVVTANPDNLFSKEEKYSENVLINRFAISNIKKNDSVRNNVIPKRDLIKYLIRDILYFPDRYCWWYLRKLFSFYQLLKKNNINLMMATASPYSTFLSVYLLNKMTGIPYIIDFRDPWSKSRGSNYQTFIRKILTPFFEKLIIKNAQGIVFSTKSIERSVSDIKTSAQKIVLTNGFDKNDLLINDSNRDDNEKRDFNENCFRFMYTGNCNLKSPVYNPESIVEAFVLFKEKYHPVNCSLIIIGVTDDDTMDYFKRYKRYDVIAHPFIERNEVVKEQYKAGCLINFIYPEVYPEIINLKLLEYISFEKPILNFVCEYGETHDVITENHFGISVSNSDIEKMSEAYYKIFSKEVVFNSDPQKINQYDIKNIGKQLSMFLKRVSFKEDI